MYNYRNIANAAFKALTMHFLCYELTRGTFTEPNPILPNLTTLNEKGLNDIAHDSTKFGGLFQGYLDENGNII